MKNKKQPPSKEKCKCTSEGNCLHDAHCSPAKKECPACLGEPTIVDKGKPYERYLEPMHLAGTKQHPEPVGEEEWEEQFKLWKPYFDKWVKQGGRNKDMRYGVQNFMTGAGAIMLKDLLASQKKFLLKDIKKWTKGRNVTKDSLRNYLNKELEKKR